LTILNSTANHTDFQSVTVTVSQVAAKNTTLCPCECFSLQFGEFYYRGEVNTHIEFLMQ